MRQVGYTDLEDLESIASSDLMNVVRLHSEHW